MESKVGYMSFETFQKCFKDFVPHSIKLNWRGEPLLHPDICRFVRYAKNMGVHEVALNTNGLLLNDELALQLAEAGLDWIIISVDGFTKATYESIRVGGNFETLFKNIINLKILYTQLDNPPKIRMQICKQPTNEHEIEDWKRFFGKIADKIRVGNLYNPQGKRDIVVKQPKSCGQLWQRMVVAWNGDVYPCPSDYLGKRQLGSVGFSSLVDMWHGYYFTLLRKMLIRGGRKRGPNLCHNCSSYC